MNNVEKIVKLSDEGFLICPCCHGDYLHEQEFERWEISGNSIFREEEESQYKKFYCENCPTNPILRIFQHKGRTLLEWISIRIMIN